MFDDHFKKMDKQIDTVQRMAVVGTIVSIGITVGVLGFVGWVVVKLLAHFGVL